MERMNIDLQDKEKEKEEDVTELKFIIAFTGIYAFTSLETLVQIIVLSMHVSDKDPKKSPLKKESTIVIFILSLSLLMMIANNIVWVCFRKKWMSHPRAMQIIHFSIASFLLTFSAPHSFCRSMARISPNKYVLTHFSIQLLQLFLGTNLLAKDNLPLTIIVQLLQLTSSFIQLYFNLKFTTEKVWMGLWNDTLHTVLPVGLLFASIIWKQSQVE
jgi:hypothetical protein